MRGVGVVVSAALLASCGSGSDPRPAGEVGDVVLIPGDDVYVTGDRSNEHLTNLHEVTAPSPLVDVIHLTMKSETIAGSPSTELNVQNFFADPFVYHALVRYAAHPNDLVPSSTCPVRPAISSVELWPDPITAIVVRDVMFRADGACAYY